MVKKFIKSMSLALALVLAFSLAGCGKNNVVSDEDSLKTPEQQIEENKKITDEQVDLVQFDTVPAGAEVAFIETSMGDITVALYPEHAPKAVENFIALAKSGYYTGLKFHRVVNNYMLQSGDPTGTGTGGESSFKDESGNKVGFEQEYSLNLWNFKGAVGMAPSGDGTNGSQFYIIQNSVVEEETLSKMQEAAFPQKVIDKYKEVGGAPWLDGKNTVFGYIIEGMDVIDEIAAVEVDANRAPVEDVIITNITIEKY
ncbi:peptidylprolyl isomerase [Hydrogenoanaerobacterium sp.]|uniref:peptidylprolyl isomerase n=1 Tax=Hydrogenoanaerobacterium sp. TaxID=2953763 RepID=UPI0028A0A11F|nr:peptidylprolyl isomerase [Hydrogenoanaerobacterium sp.]